jgi:hypothetical protein
MNEIVDALAVLVVVQRSLDYQEIAGEEEASLRQAISALKATCDALDRVAS